MPRIEGGKAARREKLREEFESQYDRSPLMKLAAEATGKTKDAWVEEHVALQLKKEKRWPFAKIAHDRRVKEFDKDRKEKGRA